MVMVVIDNTVKFSPNNGVRLTTRALNISAKKLKRYVSLAFSHMDDMVLRDACHGGIGILGNVYEVSYTDYCEILQEDLKRRATVQKALLQRRSAGKRLRKKVIERDNSRCRYCGKKVSGSELHLDHVLPYSRGGPTKIDNLVVSCRSCNLKKGRRSLGEVDMELII